MTFNPLSERFFIRDDFVQAKLVLFGNRDADQRNNLYPKEVTLQAKIAYAAKPVLDVLAIMMFITTIAVLAGHSNATGWGITFIVSVILRDFAEGYCDYLFKNRAILKAKPINATTGKLAESVDI